MIEKFNINVCDLDYNLWYKLGNTMSADYLSRLRKFASKFPIVEFEKHNQIEYENGDGRQEYFFFITNGFVRHFLEKRSGEMLSIEIDSAGDLIPFIFNSISIRGFKIPSVKTDCLSPVTAYKIPREELQEFFENNRDIFYARLEEALTYTDFFLDRTAIIIYGSVREKLARFLLDLSKEYSEKINGNILISVEMNHKDIGSFIGTTREATSIELGKLKKAKIISYTNHKIEILDMGKLRKIADN